MNNNRWSSSQQLKTSSLGSKQGMRILLSILVVIFIVLEVEAVEDGSSKRKDGGSPGQAVAPVKLVVHPQADRLDELDGEQNQAAPLEDHCRTDQERTKQKRRFDVSLFQLVLEANVEMSRPLRTCGEEYDGYGLVAATPAAEAE